MTPRVVRLIKQKGDAIQCEAEPGEGGGHAGLIVLLAESGVKEVLGRTDPTFDNATDAVAAVEDAVAVVRNGEPAESTPAVEPKRETRSRKRKGEGDVGSTNS